MRLDRHRSTGWNGTALAAVPFVLCALMLSGCGGPSAPPLSAVFVAEDDAELPAGIRAQILQAQRALAERPEDAVRAFALADLYLQAVRETADTFYYARAEDVLLHAEEADPNNPEIPYQRGMIAMGRHDFPAALRYGTQVVSTHPDVARYRGLLGDAQVETGLYKEAVATFQAMADIRPDASALTRIAYVREIHGDREGAAEAMLQAIEAGFTNAENLAWTYAELGRLALPSSPADAEEAYRQALAVYPDHPPSLAGMARVHMARGRPAEARAAAEKALKSLALPEYAVLVGDLYAAEGNAAKADAYYKVADLGYDVIASGGTDVALERAAFLAAHGLRTEEAVSLARGVVAVRPTIYAEDALAWALHAAGKDDEAWEAAQRAMATGTADPVILFHAGMIAKAAGKPDQAAPLLRRVRDESPFFSFSLKPALESALKDL